MSQENKRKNINPIDALIALSILGVLAMMGVPMLLEHMQRAKTHEALDQVDKIYKSALIYYTTPQIREGETLPCQFPQTQGITPTEWTCCSSGGMQGNDKNGDDRCDVNPANWETTTWTALSFKIVDEHYYTYAFNSSGVDARAAFTASAFGDLDCDGVTSTFQRMGFANPSSSPRSTGTCKVYDKSNFMVTRETE